MGETFTKRWYACPAMDPRRGVACTRERGHDGDHRTIAGFPFEATVHGPWPTPTAEDIAAAMSIIAEAGWCDDCGRADGTHDEEVEH